VSEYVEGRCICNSYAVQVEDPKFPFYDPKNNALWRTDGRKFRYMWFGCPIHDGRSFMHVPPFAVGRRMADAQK